MTGWRQTAALLLLTAGVSACAGNPSPQPQSSGAGTAGTTIAALPAEPAIKAIPEPVEQPAPPPVPVADTSSFLNRNGSEIAEVLGAPGFVRKDPPAELWQYRTALCTLDLYFYDEGGGNYELGWLDFRGVEATTAARDECLREILRQKTG